MRAMQARKLSNKSLRDFPTFLKSGPEACSIWEKLDQTIKIGKTGFSQKRTEFPYTITNYQWKTKKDLIALDFIITSIIM